MISTLLWLNPLFISCALAADSRSVAVLPLVAQGGEDEAWLGTGIADLLMQDLAESGALRVVERTRLGRLIREAELAQSGFTDVAPVQQVARIARLDEAVFGNYRLAGRALTINVLLLDVASTRIVYRNSVSGSLDDLHQLVERLAHGLFDAEKIALTPEEARRVAFRPTRSIPATAHYYRGLDAVDSGRAGDALAAFIAASARDPRYHDARLALARVLDANGRGRLAVAAYDDAYQHAGRRMPGRDALLSAALLSATAAPGAAEARLRTLIALAPPSPHNIEGNYQLAQVLKTRGDMDGAHAALGRVERLHQLFQKPGSRRRLPRSTFLSWPDALDRHRDARLESTATYAALAATAGAANANGGSVPAPPRGVVAPPAETGAYAVRAYRDLKPLFADPGHSENWREKFYTVVVPPGHVATGIDLSVRGELTQRAKHHDFTMRVFPYPMPRNFHNTWLGVIYGQTERPTRLTKHVPFYGRDQRLLTLQFIENHGRIYDWGIRLHLRPDTNGADEDAGVATTNKSLPVAPAGLDGDTLPREGEVIAVVPPIAGPAGFDGVTRSLADHWYEARQRVAMADLRTVGQALVFVGGTLDSGTSDLWFAQLAPDLTVSTPERLPFNALTHDFSPQLVRGEDGDLRVFWISDRRGTGWDLWTSSRDAASGTWQGATRVPLDTLAEAAFVAGSKRAKSLLHYGVTQDRRGRWVVAWRARGKRVALATSTDAINWSLAGTINNAPGALNPAVVEDSTGRYRVAAFTDDGLLHLWTSNDLGAWHERSLRVNRYGDTATVAPHRIQLIARPRGKLMVLLSDASRGLQYARFDPDRDDPRFDLARNTGLEAWGATLVSNGYLVAAERNDDLVVRFYRHFQEGRVARNAPGRILYTERLGEAWQRITARVRAIQPDVTGVGVHPGGRVWWGIETGAMTLHDDAFYGVDVSQGFFHHHVTHIEPCTGGSGLASRDKAAAEIGLAVKRGKGFAFRRVVVEEASENSDVRITAMRCIEDRLLVGTSVGGVYDVTGGEVNRLWQTDAVVTALAADRADGGGLVAGTAHGRLWRVRANGEAKPMATPSAGAAGRIHALERDADGRLWISQAGVGIAFIDVVADRASAGDANDRDQQEGGETGTPGWRTLARLLATPRASAGSDESGADGDMRQRPWQAATLRADPRGGMWMMPLASAASQGILWSDGRQAAWHNPPDRILFAPTGLGVDAEGVVWVGTAFDGLFRFEGEPGGIAGAAGNLIGRGDAP